MVNEKAEWGFLDLRKDVGVEDERVHKITAGTVKINKDSGVIETMTNWWFEERNWM